MLCCPTISKSPTDKDIIAALDHDESESVNLCEYLSEGEASDCTAEEINSSNSDYDYGVG